MIPVSCACLSLKPSLWALPLNGKAITQGVQAWCCLIPHSRQHVLSPLGLQKYNGHWQKPGTCLPGYADLPLSTPRSHQPLCLVGGASPLGQSMGHSSGTMMVLWTLPLDEKVMTWGLRAATTCTHSHTEKHSHHQGQNSAGGLQAGEQSQKCTRLPVGWRVLTYLYHLSGGGGLVFHSPSDVKLQGSQASWCAVWVSSTVQLVGVRRGRDKGNSSLYLVADVTLVLCFFT